MPATAEEHRHDTDPAGTAPRQAFGGRREIGLLVLQKCDRDFQVGRAYDDAIA